MSRIARSLELAQATLHKAQKIAVLTGAGISAESGIPTFRGQDGLWRNYRPEDLATPQAYAKNPILVWEWYAIRLKTVSEAQPNAAHIALANLQHQKDLTLVTQNVDGLHQRAGSAGVLELHGNITQSRCEGCGQLDSLQPDFKVPPSCSNCKSVARPNLVWFGEALPQKVFERAITAFSSTEVALIIGTSSLVEPAASLGRLAAEQRAYVIEINPQKTPLSRYANLSLQMTASQGLNLLLGNE
jgi:NAD-dependent deacetylase